MNKKKALSARHKYIRRAIAVGPFYTTARKRVILARNKTHQSYYRRVWAIDVSAVARLANWREIAAWIIQNGKCSGWSSTINPFPYGSPIPHWATCD